MVSSAYLDTYLDHSYSLTPLSRAYRFEPVFPELVGDIAERALGLEAPMWTEWVPNRARLDYQTYPRLIAFAETGWTPKSRKNYADFRTRLIPFLERLDLHGVRYAPESDWEPPWLKRAFGVFTVMQPQKGIAP
jgi:hexosaminidase